MRFLPHRICLGNPGTGLAQPKAQLPEQTLALPHPQINLVPLGNPSRQSFAVPQIPPQPHIPRHLAKRAVDSPSRNPAKPFCSKPRTQYSTDRGASPNNLATSGQVIPWATKSTP